MSDGPTLVPTLDEIAAGRGLADVPNDALTALHERAEVAAARLRARLLAIGIDGRREPTREPDRAVGLDEAAEMLGMSTDFLYRRWAKLGLGFKDADGHVKFRLSRLQRYLTARG